MKWTRKYGEEEVDFYLNERTGLCGWAYTTGGNADTTLLKEKTEAEVEEYFRKNIESFFERLDKFYKKII